MQTDDRIDFECVLGETLTPDQARRQYERADLLVDQLLAGWSGALAVELMALGKPVICYLREGDLRFLPAAMRADLPLIHAQPATIYDVLKQWLTAGRNDLAARGKQSRQYVERWHDPQKIAVRLAEAYRGIVKSECRSTKSETNPKHE